MYVYLGIYIYNLLVAEYNLTENCVSTAIPICFRPYKLHNITYIFIYRYANMLTYTEGFRFFPLRGSLNLCRKL